MVKSGGDNARPGPNGERPDDLFDVVVGQFAPYKRVDPDSSVLEPGQTLDDLPTVWAQLTPVILNVS